MRISRLFLLLVIALVMSSCVCRTKRVGDGSNIPVAQTGDILKDIHFAFDRYDLSAAARMVLSMNAQWLKENPEAKVEIEGHCDERGTNEYNMALGSKRAKAAQEYLRSLGIEAGRMRTVSYGEELPLDPGHNEEAWAKNRRAHFNLMK